MTTNNSLTAGQLRAMYGDPATALPRLLASWWTPVAVPVGRPPAVIAPKPSVSRPTVHRMAEQWEHGTLVVRPPSSRPGKIEFLTANDEETVSHENASPQKVMNALDVLSTDGWELVGGPTAVQADGVITTSYLLRRPQRVSRGRDIPRRIH